MICQKPDDLPEAPYDLAEAPGDFPEAPHDLPKVPRDLARTQIIFFCLKNVFIPYLALFKASLKW